jgi:hypothetical protein
MTQEFLAAIGAVTIEFSILERHLHFGIWVLLGLSLAEQATGQMVTAGLSFRTSVDLFAALVRHRFPSAEGKHIQSVIGRVNEAEQKRNVIVHSTWAQAEGEQVMRMKTTARGELKHQFEKMTLADVQAIATQIHAAAEEVLNLYLGLLSPDHRRATL